MSVTDEHCIPSKVLRKTKAPEKKGDSDKDDKKPNRRSAMLSFIAKHKNGE